MSSYNLQPERTAPGMLQPVLLKVPVLDMLVGGRKSMHCRANVFAHPSALLLLPVPIPPHAQHSSRQGNCSDDSMPVSICMLALSAKQEGMQG